MEYFGGFEVLVFARAEDRGGPRLSFLEVRSKLWRLKGRLPLGGGKGFDFWRSGGKPEGEGRGAQGQPVMLVCCNTLLGSSWKCYNTLQCGVGWF